MGEEKPISDNPPEVQEAMDVRDALLEDVKAATDDVKEAAEESQKAIADVDRLMQQYRDANGVDK